MKFFTAYLVLTTGAFIFLKISEHSLAVQAETAAQTAKSDPGTAGILEPKEVSVSVETPDSEEVLSEELQKEVEEYLGRQSKQNDIASEEIDNPIWTVAPELLERMAVVEREFFLERNPKLRSLWGERERRQMSNLSEGPTSEVQSPRSRVQGPESKVRI